MQLAGHSRKLPQLRDDVDILFNLYHKKQIVSTREMATAFGISMSKANSVISIVGRVPNTMGVNVRVAQLFDTYGWDIKKINQSYKTLHS